MYVGIGSKSRACRKRVKLLSTRRERRPLSNLLINIKIAILKQILFFRFLSTDFQSENVARLPYSIKRVMKIDGRRIRYRK